MTNPMINIVNGIYNAFLTFNASFKYFLSGLRLISNLAMTNKITSTIIKSKPYNNCGSNTLGLSATKIVIYGTNEKTNINKIFNHITFVLILSTC